MALLLPVLYSIRSERGLMHQIDLHLGFRRFVGLVACPFRGPRIAAEEKRVYFGPNKVSRCPSGSVKVAAQDPGVTSRGAFKNLHPRPTSNSCDAPTLSTGKIISVAPARGWTACPNGVPSANVTLPAEKKANSPD